MMWNSVVIAVVTLIISVNSLEDFTEEWKEVKSPFDMSDYPDIKDLYFPEQDEPNQFARIAGGINAELGEFPYFAILAFKNEAGKKNQCGGTILHRNYIVTAAHCAHKKDSVIVIVGMVDVTVPAIWALQVSKKNMIEHPDYVKNSSINDIALIRLVVPIPLSENVTIAHLPENDEYDLDRQYANVTGFGRYQDNSTKLSPYLQYASVQIIHNSVCEYFFNSKMRDTNICVGTKQKKSPCIGDSGGGLTIYEEHKGPIVYGIVSFGDEIGCQLGYPAVFTRVSSYIQWIDKNTDYQIEYRRGNQRTRF